MGLLGHTVGRMAGKSVSNGASVLGGAMVLASHPWQTSAALLGVGTIMGYGSSRTQSIAPTGATVQPRPGSSQKESDFDLGASGDLVFALHRNH